MERVGGGALAAYGLVMLVHVVAQLTGPQALADATQWLAMPLLIVTMVAAVRVRPETGGRLARLTVVALFFSWLGDTLPHAVGGNGFLVLVGMFLLAQVAYAAAFWPYRGDSVLAPPRWRVVPYVVVIVALFAVCAPGAGSLLVPVAVYAVFLGVMAVLATGLHRFAAVGGALFLASDGLIAIGEFAKHLALPAHSFWVMLTYLAAQLLIVLGVLRRRVLDADGDVEPDAHDMDEAEADDADAEDADDNAPGRIEP